MGMTRKQLQAAGIDPGFCKKGGPKATSDRKARERLLEAAAVAHGLPAPVFEYQFWPGRKWRFDVLFDFVAIEIQGGIFTEGRHVRGAALLDEYEKLNHAALAGFSVLFFTPQQIDSGAAFRFVATMLKGE